MIIGKAILTSGGKGIPCNLTITTTPGTKVIASLGRKEVACVADSSGIAVLELKEEGTWTVTAEYLGITSSITVDVTHRLHGVLQFTSKFSIICKNVQYDYEFMDGWTWNEFMASEFNDGNFVKDGTKVTFFGYTVVNGDANVLASDLVIVDASYAILEKTYVFKEGEGLVFGGYASYSSSYAYCGTDYINLSGRRWSTNTHDDDASYGMIIGAKAIETDSSGWYAAGSGFDFSNYKTLYFEYASNSGSTNHGYAGYCQDQRISSSYLKHEDNTFNSYRLSDLYKGGTYKAIQGTRKTISFDISAKTGSFLIAMLSPLAYDSNCFIKVYNIWFE